MLWILQVNFFVVYGFPVKWSRFPVKWSRSGAPQSFRLWLNLSKIKLDFTLNRNKDNS